MKKQYIIIGGIILAVIAGIYLSGGGKDSKEADQEGILKVQEAAGDPVDGTLAFYRSWLDAVKDITVDPYTSSVATDPILSQEVKSYIAEGDTSGVDPVLCLANVPEKVRAKSVFVYETEAQVLVLGRGGSEKTPEQAIVDLAIVDGVWQISKISCVYGESAPEREFTFEQEGFLLKSVPAPLDSNYWHLIFEENGEKGHWAQLLFTPQSICVAIDGSEGVCDESQFVEASKALIKGQMTESGPTVVRLELLGE